MIAFAESQYIVEARQQPNKRELVLGFICVDYLIKVGVLVHCVSAAQTSVFLLIHALSTSLKSSVMNTTHAWVAG